MAQSTGNLVKHFQLGGGPGSDGPLSMALWNPLAEFFDEEEAIDGIGWNFSSNRSTDELSKPSSSAPAGGALDCRLFHKVRGGKGEWKEVVHCEMIRVTKGVGKKVKLVLKSPPPIHFKVTDISLFLEDQADGSFKTSRFGAPKNQSTFFSVENSNIKHDAASGTCAELFLKVFRLGKQLSFVATVAPKQNNSPPIVLSGSSVIFGTHNSGKQRKKKDRSESLTSSAGGDSVDSPPDSPAGGEEDIPGDEMPELPRDKRRRLEPTATDPTASEWSSSSPRSSSAKSEHNGYDSSSPRSASSPRLPRRTPSTSPRTDSPDSSQNFLKRSAAPLKQFCEAVVAPEAHRRGSLIALFLALRQPKIDPNDWTIFLYKGIHLISTQAFAAGSKHGRLIFLPADTAGDYSGNYTLVVGTRAQQSASNCSLSTSLSSSSSSAASSPSPPQIPNPFGNPAGVACLLDYRVDPFAIRIIPAEPVSLGTYSLDNGGTAMWMIAPFRILSTGLTWLSVPASPKQSPLRPPTAPLQVQPLVPAAPLPTAAPIPAAFFPTGSLMDMTAQFAQFDPMGRTGAVQPSPPASEESWYASGAAGAAPHQQRNAQAIQSLHQHHGGLHLALTHNAAAGNSQQQHEHGEAPPAALHGLLPGIDAEPTTHTALGHLSWPRPIFGVPFSAPAVGSSATGTHSSFGNLPQTAGANALAQIPILPIPSHHLPPMNGGEERMEL